MNVSRGQREELGLTQTEAAARAGVSLATWRRWEEGPSLVKESTRTACEGVLSAEPPKPAIQDEIEKFGLAWMDCPYVIPRQAYAIAGELRCWVDLTIGEWLKEPSSDPLHQVSPFDQIDLRVMMQVNENRAWAAKVMERCEHAADEIAGGVLLFDRPGCYMDEFLIGLAMRDARASMSDDPEMYEKLVARAGDDENVGDEEWDAVSDEFDDRCQWDDWEVPTLSRAPPPSGCPGRTAPVHLVRQCAVDRTRLPQPARRHGKARRGRQSSCLTCQGVDVHVTRIGVRSASGLGRRLPVCSKGGVNVDVTLYPSRMAVRRPSTKEAS